MDHKAIISLSRAHGRRHLFECPVSVESSIELTISTARASNMSDGTTSHYAGRQLIRVALSASQFAELITTMNSGGVPCTLSRFDGTQIPEPQAPSSDPIGDLAGKRARAGYDRHVKAMNEQIGSLKRDLNEGKVPVRLAQKMQATLRDMEHFVSMLQSDTDFVEHQLLEQADKLTQQIKTEVHATFDLLVKQAGQAALTDAHPSSSSPRLLP